MVSDSNRNYSPPIGTDGSLQAKKRVRYVLPKGCVIGGSYCIEKPLGHGGMGEVYLARHMKLDIYRAIKILLPKIAVKNPMFATRFMREAKLAIQLQHPNIINVMDAEYDERLSIYYIVMEYVDGGTVRNLIRKNGPLDEQEVLKIVLRVGEALAVGEERKIVHRDIKPDNIMLTKDNVVKLADLGIAKSSADSNDVDVTSPEILIGTPAYVSPEQARDAQHVDSRADIYSLGVSMYEMLTGEKPYKGKTTVEILQQLFEASVPEVRQKNKTVSRKVSDLVYRMMAKEKEKRPRNWKIFCKEVSKLLGEDETANSSETATTSVENIKDLLPKNKGIVLGSDENKPFVDKKKIKKAVKYSAVAVSGFVLCFLLLSGALSKSNLLSMRDSLILGLIGRKYREQCEKYQINPPLYLLLASGDLKQAWIDQNQPEKKEIDIKPEDLPKPPVPPVNPAYLGNGTLEFKVEASPEVEAWLKEKQHKLTVSAEKYVKETKVAFSEKLTVPAGKYPLKMSIPECRAFPSVLIDLKTDHVQVVNVVVRPVEATVKVSCNVKDFYIWRNGAKLKTGELKVAPLQDVEFFVDSPGYRTRSVNIKDQLQPGEVRNVAVSLELSPTKKADSQRMIRAKEEFKNGKYHSAVKLLDREAADGNPEAMYMAGICYKEKLGLIYRDINKAINYFSKAANEGYPDAMYQVGKYHENRRKYNIALQWYQRGSESNHVDSMIKVAEFHEKGLGNAERSQNLALNWYLRAAEFDVPSAQYKAALIYEQKMRYASSQQEKDKLKKQARILYDKVVQDKNFDLDIFKEAKKRLHSL